MYHSDKWVIMAIKTFTFFFSIPENRKAKIVGRMLEQETFPKGGGESLLSPEKTQKDARRQQKLGEIRRLA